MSTFLGPQSDTKRPASVPARVWRPVFFYFLRACDLSGPGCNVDRTKVPITAFTDENFRLFHIALEESATEPLVGL